MVLYLPLPIAGITLTPWLILIHSSRRDDKALFMHEQKHVQQMKAYGWLYFVWRYLTSKRFRLDMEVEAYKVSIENGRSIDGCAQALSTMYRLGISFEDARNLLK